MAFRTFSNGNKIPWIGFGTGGHLTSSLGVSSNSFTAGTALYGRSAEQSITTALEAGFKHIDCAEMYGNEESVGNALKTYLSTHPRDSIFVTTKLNKIPPGKTARDSLQTSLRKLQLDYVDLYLIHTPVPHEGRIAEVWKQMEEVYKEGLAKNIGVSNFRLKDFETFIDSAEIIPVVNQVRNPTLCRCSEAISDTPRVD